ncbi:MAG TPA: BolA/IbaG family iron-sulfur metabolism protein [Kofleriaceae bacterium]|nr:BolA/IbaG family iron-sulfur metabolism protein [Kofleriaceae bacterium]
MSPDAIRERIRAALPDADVTLEDLTGTADHWKARIVSAAFAGCSPVERHRLVNRALAVELAGPIHALTMELLTPHEASSS